MSRRWSRALRVLLGVAILALVLGAVDGVAAVRLLGRADPVLAFVGVVGLTAVHLVAASAWWSMLPMMAGVSLPWRQAMATFYAAQAIGGLTPANLGGDLHRVAALRGSGLGWMAAAAPLVVQRATSYLALAALSVAAVAGLASAGEIALPVVALGLATAGVVGLASWLVLAPPSPLAWASARLLRSLGGTPDSDLRRAKALAPATLLGLTSGFAFHALSIGFTFLVILAVDPGVAVVPSLAAITVARLSLAVPITPSGLGVQEGLLAGLFAATGMAPESAVAGLLLGRLALALTSAIGAGVLIRASGPPVTRPGPALR